MPTIHRRAGFRFMIYVDDHTPAHAHVWYGGALAKINLGSRRERPGVRDAGTMKGPDLRRAVRIVEKDQERFLVAWRRIHGT